MSTRRGEGGIGDDGVLQLQPVHAGHGPVDEGHRERPAVAGRAPHRLQRAAPESAVLTVMPQSVRYSDRTPRCVALSSTISARDRRGRRRAECRRPPAGVGVDADREPEVLPSPSLLDTPQSPPMSATSWLLMASPRPVPPYFREVDVSAWTKGWKIAPSLSGAMPSPVSDDLEADDGVGARRPRSGDANDDLARPA